MPAELVAAGQLWHAALGVGPLNVVWKGLVEPAARLFPTESHLEHALEHARNLIFTKYDLGGIESGNKEQVVKLLKKLPFVYGQQVSDIMTSSLRLEKNINCICVLRVDLGMFLVMTCSYPWRKLCFSEQLVVVWMQHPQ